MDARQILDGMREKSSRDPAPKRVAVELMDDPIRVVHVLIYGESHVRKMAPMLEEQNDCVKIDCMGISGANMRDWRDDREMLESYDVIVLVLGGNDISVHPRHTEKAPDTVASTFNFVRDCCRQSRKHILVGEVIPRLSNIKGIGFLNRRIVHAFTQQFVAASLLKPEELTWAPDNVHLTQAAYLRYAMRLKSFVYEFMFAKNLA